VSWYQDALDRNPAVEDLEGFVTVGEAAEQMDLTEQRVRQLARDRTLRSTRWGGVLFVQPAITNRN
jgi:excisionase family DNA binding protein